MARLKLGNMAAARGTVEIESKRAQKSEQLMREGRRTTDGALHPWLWGLLTKLD